MRIFADKFPVIASQVKKKSLRLKLEMYHKIPAIKTVRDRAYRQALSKHSVSLPLLDSQSESILGQLRQEGTCIIPIKELGFASSEIMLKEALALADKLKFRSLGTKKNRISELGSRAEDLREFPQLLLWALEPKLLNIAEHYIGLPPLYQYVAIRRSAADGQQTGIRNWHLDCEDRRLLKIIIYLNDVATGDGPYEYISRSLTSKAIKKLNYYNLGNISEDEMRTAIPKSDWTSCLEKQGNVIITDTANVFHRIQPPINKERFSITYCYTSTSPQAQLGTDELSTRQKELIAKNTNLRQQKCLPKQWRW